MTWGIPFALYVERRTAMLNQVAHLVLVAYVDLRLPPTCSRFTCLLITSETLLIHLVYEIKFWGFNRCHSKCLRNKNTLVTCKSHRPTSGRSELAKSCTTSTMNFHMMYFSWIPQNNASLKLSCKFGNLNTIFVKISHRRLHMAQITRMSLMCT